MATLGERLKLLRKEFNLSQEKLADNLNISRGSLSMYELDKAEPPDSIKKIFCSYFNVSMDFLCGFSTTRTNDLLIKINKNNYVQVPIVDKILDNTKISKHYTIVPKEKLIDGSCFFISAPEDYPLERIKKNDLLFIREHPFGEENTLMLISINNTLHISKLLEDGPNYILFNPSSDPQFSRLQKSKIKIIGKILEVTFKL